MDCSHNFTFLEKFLSIEDMINESQWVMKGETVNNHPELPGNLDIVTDR